MKRICFILVLLLFIPFQGIVDAHSGRTDSNGGHNCSEKSQAKGLCSGYHYHNGGGDTSPSDSSSSSSTSTSNQSWDKDCSDFSTYDEVVEYWNSKGYSKTNDPEKLDGWGNAVDDGIPCEAPSDYDTTNINGSPEQIAQETAEQDIAKGEKDGYAVGLEDGYQEKENNPTSSNGSDAYESGYASGYSKGFGEGSTKIASEKKQADQDGYSLGQKQDKIEISSKYTNNKMLSDSFTVGFNRAVEERDKKKEAELEALGYEDGKKDKQNEPKNVKESYLMAYQNGFNKGQEDLKQSYIDKGYQAAFTLLEYKKPDFGNEKYITWYKEGFESNTEVEKIEEMAYDMGLEGEKLVIPKEYSDSEVIFNHYYEIGTEEYEEKERKENTLTATGFGLIILAWLARRFYVAKKMIS
ncbi:YHYH domain-containing protein [Metabacillus rhizolycopersici]|uniref:YHYH domain-containing protein n=1 Tax=Metabacillus rhizolycopersici TaxID=2875709 RepID=A0ABS7USU2_9BACI|nr:YHYH domain-containing protein [Metabacillus rhizolycopersici]MBZ5751348.1 YHYH domain-containing protein [Metabacillus rhizolycopersici]